MYETLYRKYRPQVFGDLVGQEAIARTLRNAIQRDRVAHAYLFAGARGIGKTSTARILAKALNCLRRKGGYGEPCNTCEACLEIAGGGAVDILEIDAASNRGIDEIRDLREKVKYLPASLGVKMYIVDEAHMLTTEAFNALLKTLEEPPRHVVFVLATTEPHRIPTTVLSRCQRFDFRRIDEDALVAALQKVARKEGAEIDAEALTLLAQRAEGSMRDAISLLDQLLSGGARAIGVEEARAVLGMADPMHVRSLLQRLLAQDARGAVQQVAQFYAAGVDVRELLRSLMQAAREEALSVAAAGPAHPGPASAAVTAAPALVRIWDALLAAQAELRKGGVDPRLLLDLVVLQLALGERAPSVPPATSGAVPAPGAPAEAPAAADPSGLAARGAEAWSEVVRQVSAAHRPAGALLNAAEVVSLDDTTLELRFQTEMLCQKLQEPDKLDLLRRTLTEVMGHALEVRCSVSTKGAPLRRPGGNRDEVVRDALSRFDATITRVTAVREPPGPREPR